MAKRSNEQRLFTRRQVTEGLLLTLGGAFLFGCGAGLDGGASDDAGGGGTEGDDETGNDAGTETGDDAGTETGNDAGTPSGSADEWATGGTAAMVDKASYPNPFATAATACAVLRTATEGPCTEAADRERQDVSEGYGGLPMRLALRVVDSNCNPIADAKVKIWHTQRTGSYSGDTPNNNMCLKSSSESSKHYFRGVQTTDDDGRVDFDSCFPGWYRGRAVHIHYTVTSSRGSFTSQLVFDQDLVQEIFESHPDYAEFGQPDTPNATDNVVGNSALSTYVLTTARMTDGAMLASKQIVVSG